MEDLRNDLLNRCSGRWDWLLCCACVSRWRSEPSFNTRHHSTRRLPWPLFLYQIAKICHSIYSHSASTRHSILILYLFGSRLVSFPNAVWFYLLCLSYTIMWSCGGNWNSRGCKVLSQPPADSGGGFPVLLHCLFLLVKTHTLVVIEDGVVAKENRTDGKESGYGFKNLLYSSPCACFSYA